MGCGAVPPDGDELTPPCAIADLRAVHPGGVAHELRKVRWQIVAEEVDIHSSRQLTLAIAPDKGRCFSPFFVGIGAIEHALEADSDPLRAIPTAPRAFAGSRTCSRRALQYRPAWSRYLQGAFSCVKFTNCPSPFRCRCSTETLPRPVERRRVRGYEGKARCAGSQPSLGRSSPASSPMASSPSPSVASTTPGSSPWSVSSGWRCSWSSVRSSTISLVAPPLRASFHRPV